MQPVIDPTIYSPTPVTYNEIFKALSLGGFNCAKDEDDEPIVITEKNQVIFYSLDSRTKSIAIYTMFYGDAENAAENEELVDELSDDFETPCFAINRNNLHVRFFVSCYSGLYLPELYRATQLICRDVNILVDDQRVLSLFQRERNKDVSVVSKLKVN